MSLGMMVNLGTAMSLRVTINLRMAVVEHYRIRATTIIGLWEMFVAGLRVKHSVAPVC